MNQLRYQLNKTEFMAEWHDNQSRRINVVVSKELLGQL